MTTTGTCTRTDTTCKAGHFCPTSGMDTVDCIPCELDMKFDQGCYCEDNSVTTNCKTCSGKNCTACLPGTFLNGNVCSKCQNGCAECTESNSCQKYTGGVTTENAKLGNVCYSNKDCEYEISTFCDITQKRCVRCSANCQVCSSATFCNGCQWDNYITTLKGTCTAMCSGLTNGNYCKDGVATPCGEGIDSNCKCGTSSNCASCNTAQNACETCLPNVLKGKDGACNICAPGFTYIGSRCWSEQQGSEANKIGSGAIVGIVISVLVVVGAVGGGLTYYFIRKGKK
ncbi:Cysteine-rich membrane protein 1 [Spironucleus salmonicida]|uniref:Cysteine-rich membrane protein 1 n=1 Tax=Spironucleus salmonicida TaxID=348837 RepID=V6LAX6_9EUKA|nr:Cysteine-rich membrane protein 1 [Spironucleus salmonicida]KAH0569657.1 Cysteine-rich membrane protein 1 [Spironucleus salmonicida]|eukprot:EST41567.1 Cysteine-rich membrane protein 1 [Spironucleus salmonicida]